MIFAFEGLPRMETCALEPRPGPGPGPGPSPGAGWPLIASVEGKFVISVVAREEGRPFEGGREIEAASTSLC